MTKTTVTKLLTAAATVATSAFLASNVAIGTAKAAKFTLNDESAAKFESKWLLEAPGVESVEDLFRELEDNLSVGSDWGASYGGEELVFDEGELTNGKGNSDPDLVVVNAGVGDSDVSLFLGVMKFWEFEVDTFTEDWVKYEEEGGGGERGVSVPEPTSAIALGVLGAGLVASRRRRRSK